MKELLTSLELAKQLLSEAKGEIAKIERSEVAKTLEKEVKPVIDEINATSQKVHLHRKTLVGLLMECLLRIFKKSSYESFLHINLREGTRWRDFILDEKGLHMGGEACMAEKLAEDYRYAELCQAMIKKLRHLIETDARGAKLRSEETQALLQDLRAKLKQIKPQTS